MLAGMDAFLLESFYDGLLKAGFPAVLLAIAVWWFNGQTNKLVTKLETTVTSWQADVKTLYEKRITDLEKRSDACERDRDEMRKIIWSHLEQDAIVCKTCTHFNPSPPKPANATTTRH